MLWQNKQLQQKDDFTSTFFKYWDTNLIMHLLRYLSQLLFFPPLASLLALLLLAGDLFR